MLKDKAGREIDYLRISVTDRCNLRCVYCMPAAGIPLKRHDDILSYEKIAAVADAAARLGIGKIRLTGGEPLVRKGIVDLVAMLHAIKGIDEIAMTTNGTLLTKELASALRDAGLDRINISLDTLERDRYREITREGDIADVISGITSSGEAGFTGTKINMVVFERTSRNEIEAMKNFCTARGLQLQTIRHFSLPRGFEAADMIHPCTRPLPCSRCNRIRLTADGYLKPCLFSDSEIVVDFNDIEGSLKRAVAAKPATGSSCKVREMVQIGG